jgi:hypothetical protein
MHLRPSRRTAAVVLAATILPVAAATSAQASTTSSLCTVTPLKPIFDGFNSSGVKMVKFKVSVSCSGNRSIEIQQNRYEEDGFLNPDDGLGSSTFNRVFGPAGGVTFYSRRTLPNTESGNEEIYHKVRFRVTSGGVTSPWTSWEKSAVASMPN